VRDRPSGASHPTGVDRETANHVITSTFVLSGLRLRRERARDLFRGIRAVEESTTYQYIIEQGGVKTLKRLLLRQGTRKFGAPNKTVKAAIEQFDVDDLGRLERMSDRIATATSWDEILQTQ
jgi:hypothetical protein